ncbi:hypothetical protein [Photorhabdus aegyptia]|uniref:Uncharacterized protein n=1 Tax=Photorhabdus aegyptia TaxID=2805098 RepID=A0A022PCY9_9GAMM|nr:hypothetical protein [Photorhabdus aegyptia]EYU13389.1 hypothetical protein BA1DRAFT_04137 [Photorhabdus aegyptia]
MARKGQKWRIGGRSHGSNDENGHNIFIMKKQAPFFLTKFVSGLMRRPYLLITYSGVWFYLTVANYQQL